MGERNVPVIRKRPVFSCESEMHLQRLACLHTIPLHIKEITQKQKKKYNYTLLDKFSSLPVAQVSKSLKAQLKIFNIVIAIFFFNSGNLYTCIPATALFW